MSLLSQLNTLESVGLLRVAQIEPELEYLFQHALVREAAYESLLPSDRRKLHQSVGKVLERLYASRLEELAATLGYHFEAAGDRGSALKYYTKAGKRALSIFANAEAEGFLRRALSMCGEPAEQARLYSLLAESLSNQSRNSESIVTYREAIRRYQNLGDQERVARMYARAGRAAWYMDDTPANLQLALEGLAAVEGAPESHGLAMLMHEVGRAYHFNGQREEARQFTKQAMQMAERLGAMDVLADALSTYGILPGLGTEEVLGALYKAAELAESCGLLQIAARAHHNIAVRVQDLTGDLVEAEKHHQRSVEIGRLRGVISEQMVSALSLVWLHMVQGKIELVEKEMVEIQQMLPLAPQLSGSMFEFKTIPLFLEWYRGNWKSALVSLRASRELARQRGDLQGLLNQSYWLADSQVELFRCGLTHDLEEAEVVAREAVELSRRGISQLTPGLYMLSTVLVQRGKLDEAKTVFAEAENSTEESTFSSVNTRLIASIDLANAERNWEEALQTAEKLAALVYQSGRRLEWMRILFHWGVYLMKRGGAADLEKARSLLREAQRLSVEFGTKFYSDLTEQRLEQVRQAVLAQATEAEKVVAEMSSAGRLQEGFLPPAPNLPGWQVAALLDPARMTSGDFYDFIQLENGKLGLLIADVADKGAGAALFMSAARSLIRTFVAAFPGDPVAALLETNRRLLADSTRTLFVTLIYGILDPANGEFTYVNAGHNRPILLRDGKPIILDGGGVPLGVLESPDWNTLSLTVQPGERLLLYTDGVTEAQNVDEEFYGEARLETRLRHFETDGAQGLLDALLEDVHSFVGLAPQADDITVVVLAREPVNSPIKEG